MEIQTRNTVKFIDISHVTWLSYSSCDASFFFFFISVLAIIFYIQVTVLRILQLLIFEFNIVIGVKSIS